MQLLSIYCGLESPTLSEKDAHLKILHLAAQFLPNGHTVTECRGRWMSPERGLVSEKTVLVQVFAERGSDLWRAAYDLAGAYKDEASQDAVIVVRQEIEADFV